MFKKSKVCTGVLLALGSASFLAASAQAQEQLNRVEVTGSSIKRVAAEGALPVQTFTAKEIAKSGVTTVQDFIQQLPVMQGFAVAADSVGGGGGGTTTASIHDVGSQYTLVLLNGRRVAPSNSGTTIDLNSIPLAAVERIEVLTDGASALYGSDAIAGVVNFILKKGEAPLTIDARYQMPQHTGGESYNLGISKGFGDIERDGYSIFAAVSYDKFKQLKAKDREFAKTGIIDFTNGGRNLEFFNGSSRSVPPNVDVTYYIEPPLPAGSTAVRKTARTSLNPYLMKNGSCPDAHVVGGRQCIFDYTSSVEIFPEQERASFFSSGEVKLGSSGLKLFGDLALTDAHIRARIAPYPAEFGLDSTHPYFKTYISDYLTADQRANVKSVNVKYRLYDMGNRSYDYQTKANHAVVGLDGSLAGWDFNTALTYSTQKQLQNYEGGFPLADKFNAAIQAQKFDPFPYTLGTMPPEMLQALNDTQYKGNYNTTDIKMYGVDARASRELFSMSGGAAAIAIGADFRKNSYDVRANQAVAKAEILFDDPQSEFGMKRSNWGVFSELVLPVTKQLELSGAVRYDSVSGVDDTLNNKKFGDTESASTYKVSFKYRPLTNLVTRGSYGTGFRVATMSQIAQPLVDFGVTGGSYACPFKVGGYDPLGYAAKGYICDRQMEVFQGGNSELKPESSKQWTLGFVFDAADNFSMGMDYWSVKVKDAVSSVSEDLIINNPEKYIGLYTEKNKASNGQTYVAIKLMPINIGQIENEGIDWNFVLRNNLPIGRLTTRLAGTYLVKSRYTTPGTSDQWEDSMDHWGSNSAVSFRNVMNASATLDSGAWSHTLNWNYRNGYKDIHHNEDNCAVSDVDTGDCVDTQLTVKSYYTFDWQTRYAFNKSLTLVGGVTNIGDMKPPLSLRNVGSHQLGYDPRYASPIGRAFYVSAQYKF